MVQINDKFNDTHMSKCVTCSIVGFYMCLHAILCTCVWSALIRTCTHRYACINVKLCYVLSDIMCLRMRAMHLWVLLIVLSLEFCSWKFCLGRTKFSAKVLVPGTFLLKILMPFEVINLKYNSVITHMQLTICCTNCRCKGDALEFLSFSS